MAEATRSSARRHIHARAASRAPPRFSAHRRRWSPRRRRFSVALAETIEKEFTGQVTVTQVGDPGTTGNFEVTVAGKLVHSKTTMGHDKCQSGESTQKVIDAIQEAVDA